MWCIAEEQVFVRINVEKLPGISSVESNVGTGTERLVSGFQVRNCIS